MVFIMSPLISMSYHRFFHGGYPQSSSIFRWHFPWNKPCWCIPFKRLKGTTLPPLTPDVAKHIAKALRPARRQGQLQQSGRGVSFDGASEAWIEGPGGIPCRLECWFYWFYMDVLYIFIWMFWTWHSWMCWKYGCFFYSYDIVDGWEILHQLIDAKNPSIDRVSTIPSGWLAGKRQNIMYGLFECFEGQDTKVSCLMPLESRHSTPETWYGHRRIICKLWTMINMIDWKLMVVI